MKDAKELFQSCLEVLQAKEVDYGEVGETNSDIGKFLGYPPSEVCLVMLMKHINVLRRMSMYPQKFTTLDLEHRMKDAINFIVLLGFELEDKVIPFEEEPYVSCDEVL